MGEEWDCEFQLSLELSEISEIILIEINRLFIVHKNFLFQVVLVLGSQYEVLCNGQLPKLAHSIKRFSSHQVMLIHEDKLLVYNWQKQTTSACIQIPYNAFYLQQHKYHLSTEWKRVVFWKTCRLSKSRGEGITYEMQVWGWQNKQWVRIKKYSKMDRNEQMEVIYCMNSVILVQSNGYSLDFQFVDTQKSFQIQSIYKLLLVKFEAFRDELKLFYTHDELDHEFLCYTIKDNHVMKEYVGAGESVLQFPEKPKEGESLVCVDVPHFPILYSNEGITKINIGFRLGNKEKALLMLNQLESEMSETFVHAILQLL